METPHSLALGHYYTTALPSRLTTALLLGVQLALSKRPESDSGFSSSFPPCHNPDIPALFPLDRQLALPFKHTLQFGRASPVLSLLLAHPNWDAHSEHTLRIAGMSFGLWMAMARGSNTRYSFTGHAHSTAPIDDPSIPHRHLMLPPENRSRVGAGCVGDGRFLFVDAGTFASELLPSSGPNIIRRCTAVLLAARINKQCQRETCYQLRALIYPEKQRYHIQLHLDCTHICPCTIPCSLTR